MSSDFCIKCDSNLSIYCGKCVDALRDDIDALRDEIIRLKRERDEALQRLADRDKLDEASAQERRAEYAAVREENDRLTTERDEARAERDDYLAEIERLHARVEHIDKSHAHAARFEAQHHAAELEDALQQRNEALRALRQVLLSRDSAWKGGHDWQDALDEAASVYRRFGPKGI